MLALALTGATSLRSASPPDFLPPAPPWHGASENLVAKADDPWITPSERTGLTDTPNYEDTVRYLKRLCDASPLLSLQEFGRTAQGRRLYVVIAGKEGAHTPNALGAARRPVLLAQAGIHAGEIDGKDAGLMLLRDIAFAGKDALLDRATLLFVPIFNADGHERISRWNRPNQRGPLHQGWRTTAQNLNLNRDYMKADTPEMQAMLSLLQKWDPALYLDLHVTDGADYQYDITFTYNGDGGVTAWSPHISAWLDQTYRPAVEIALRAAGHFPAAYVGGLDGLTMTNGYSIGPMMPRYSHGYGDLRHLPTVLVENHSLKPYRQRVLGTYILLESSLRTLGDHFSALHQAVQTDRAARPAAIPMHWGGKGDAQTTTDFLGIESETYLSPATGRAEVRWLGKPKRYPNLPVRRETVTLELNRPNAYWVPVTHRDVIARLKRHGIRMDTLTSERTVQLDMYRLVDPRPRLGDRFHPFEGRHTLSTRVQRETRAETFPAGSVRVPTDQPLGDLAMALLEPEGTDSLFAWGFFLGILQRTEYIEGYVLAPMAEQMLADDPGLKTEFEAKLAGDPEFANNPTARLRWFYQRSPFYDERYLLYPVGIER